MEINHDTPDNRTEPRSQEAMEQASESLLRTRIINEFALFVKMQTLVRPRSDFSQHPLARKLINGELEGISYESIEPYFKSFTPLQRVSEQADAAGKSLLTKLQRLEEELLEQNRLWQALYESQEGVGGEFA